MPRTAKDTQRAVRPGPAGGVPLGPDGLPLPPYAYTPKHRWSVKLHFMSGITLMPWLSFLWHNASHIDWLWYAHRLLFLTCMAALNTLLALPDWLLFSRAIAAQRLHPEPLFILGHPRTGTTHLHNLLAADPRFAFANTFHAGFPSSFLCLEPLRGLLSPLLAPTRPMDNMALSWELPAEDELAVTSLTGGASPYTALVLPALWRGRLRRYLTWGRGEGEVQVEEAASGAEAEGGRRQVEGARREQEEAAEDGAAFAAWRSAFMWFMKKVTLRHARRRRRAAAAPKRGGAASSASASPPPPPMLLVKSPVHTARLATWLAMFPRARFVYVHRHPLEVFQSAANMADTYYWYTYLQRPTDNGTNDFIMDQYDILFRSYTRDRAGVPPGQLVEVGFAELDADPLAVLRRVYGSFGWHEHYEALRPAWERYVGSLADFKKNHFNRLSPAAEAVVRQRWAPSFEAFGYT